MKTVIQEKRKVYVKRQSKGFKVIMIETVEEYNYNAFNSFELAEANAKAWSKCLDAQYCGSI